MGAPEVRSFIGGLRAGDRGLYVSTGGFTKEARYEADRANVPVRLLDLDGFVRHYVDVYDRADDETRSILPLTRIWWPAQGGIHMGEEITSESQKLLMAVYAHSLMLAGAGWSLRKASMGVCPSAPYRCSAA